MGAVGCAEGRGRKRPFASHLPSFDEQCAEEVAVSATDDTRSPAAQRRRSARGGSLRLSQWSCMFNHRGLTWCDKGNNCKILDSPGRWGMRQCVFELWQVQQIVW